MIGANVLAAILSAHHRHLPVQFKLVHEQSLHHLVEMDVPVMFSPNPNIAKLHCAPLIVKFPNSVNLRFAQRNAVVESLCELVWLLVHLLMMEKSALV